MIFCKASTSFPCLSGCEDVASLPYSIIHSIIARLYDDMISYVDIFILSSIIIISVEGLRFRMEQRAEFP
jgi:hypothetical protein